MNDHIDALVRRMADGEALKFKFFWGHSGTGLGPWILSQWYPAPFVVDGTTYQTAEHWMMAQKALLFGDVASAHDVIAANSPGAAKALGRGVKDFDEETWEEARYAIVVTGSVFKFRQNPALGTWLDETGDVVLVEASPQDRIWGIGMSATDPWVEFPDHHRYSAFWRMGAGEDYVIAQRENWASLTPDQRIEIELVHPATGAWSGWY